MAFTLNSAGPTTILNSSSTGAGSWYRVHPKLGTMTFSVKHSGLSAGVTCQSTVYIQASNDGTNPLLTTAGTSVDALATFVTNGGSPQVQGVAINANWGWVRAFTNSISTGTIAVDVVGQMRS